MGGKKEDANIMRRLTCLLLVGVLVLVLSSVALAALTKEDLDIKLTVGPHASIEFKKNEDVIQLNLDDDDPVSKPGYARFTVRNNTPIRIHVRAYPFSGADDDDVGYDLAIERNLRRWGGNWDWFEQCKTSSKSVGKSFSKEWDWNHRDRSDSYRAKATAWRTKDWWKVEAKDGYSAMVMFTVSAQD